MEACTFDCAIQFLFLIFDSISLWIHIHLSPQPIYNVIWVEWGLGESYCDLSHNVLCTLYMKGNSKFRFLKLIATRTDLSKE